MLAGSWGRGGKVYLQFRIGVLLRSKRFTLWSNNRSNEKCELAGSDLQWKISLTGFLGKAKKQSCLKFLLSPAMISIKFTRY